MGDKSGIEWTEATWNPLAGCTKVSPGCDNCYALTMSRRIEAMGNPKYAGVTRRGYDAAGRLEPVEWTNKINLAYAVLEQPIRWTKPRRIFVNSMSDLFHDGVPDNFILQVFAVMALAPQHTFQLLTKRHGRMKSLLNHPSFYQGVLAVIRSYAEDAEQPDAALVARTAKKFLRSAAELRWPLPNVWLGVSVEDQKRANQRVMALLDTPASVRWLSMEPLLGPVDLTRIERNAWTPARSALQPVLDRDTGAVLVPSLDWIVVGGESGPGARPMNPWWAFSLRDQATNVGVPFLFKQWGNWIGVMPEDARDGDEWIGGDGIMRQPWHPESVGAASGRWHPLADHIVRHIGGKHDAGRELGGRTWDEYPG